MTRHRLDVFSLLSGLVLVVIATLALTDGFTLAVARWLWPTLLIGSGVAVLLAVLGRDRARSAVDPSTDPSTQATAHDDELLPRHREEALSEARQEVEDVDVTTD